MKVIDSFQDEYRWLSNFWGCPVMFEDIKYWGVERAFVAAKNPDPEWREEVRLSKTSYEAKCMGHNIKLRKDWPDVRVEIMGELVRDKFFRNEKLGRKLIDTGNAELIEGNHWNDKFWGVCGGEGENHLGRILMKVRDELNDWWDTENGK